MPKIRILYLYFWRTLETDINMLNKSRKIFIILTDHQVPTDDEPQYLASNPHLSTKREKLGESLRFYKAAFGAEA